MRTSYSAVDTYRQCPQRYKFQEIDKIRTPKSREAIFGTAVHKTLNYMFKSDPLFPTLDEVINNFRENWPPRESFEAEYKRDSQKRPWSDLDNKMYFQAGVRILKKFYEKNPPWNFSVLDMESRFEVALLDKKTGETHVLAGIIDRIDKTPDGHYEIIDYKTARKMPSQAALDKNLQLSLYSLGLQERWPHLKTDNIKLSLYFLKHEEKLTANITEETIKKSREHVLKTIGEIQNHIRSGKDFEPRPGPLCDFCGFRSICPAWRHLYKKETDPSQKASMEEMDKVIKEYFDLKKADKEGTARMNELKTQIEEYMARENLTRLFGEEGVLSKKTAQRYEYDWEKIKTILAELGKWEEILKADETKLKKIMKEIPESAREEVENTRKVSKEYSTLTATLKKNS